MNRRGVAKGLGLTALAAAVDGWMITPAASGQQAVKAKPAIPFVCPMDRDVRSETPSKCPRCGMALVPALADAVEYPVDIRMVPRAARPGQRVRLEIRVLEPVTRQPVRNFELIHEKLLHLFAISSDLEFFFHEHPELQPDGRFVYETTLPKSGEYRLLCDFYPAGGTPQMSAKTLVLPGESGRAVLARDLAPKRSRNMSVVLRMEPEQPLAGKKTMLFCDLDPVEQLEPYLGAWGHLLAASSDLVDLVHQHPAWDDVKRTVQFNLIFPRPGMHRIWVQFQRAGEVNTVAFNVPVADIGSLAY